METTEIIFWSLFVILTIGEILVALVFKLDKKNPIRDWVEPAFEAIIIAIVIRTFIIQAFRIPTSSMEDNLLIGDHIIANKFIYGSYIPWKDGHILKFTEPKRGDVVIFRYPENPKLMFIKRCIGLPGDVLEIKDKVVWINGKKLDEPYVFHKDFKTYPSYLTARDNYGPFTVPAGTYFLMGDNRDNSSDSRFWGPLPEKYLRGKAWLVYWPPYRWRLIKHEKIAASDPVKAAPEKPAGVFMGIKQVTAAAK